MKLFIKSVVILFITLIIVCVLLIFTTLQSSPNAIHVNQINAESAKKSEQLVKRTVTQLKNNHKTNTIKITQNEINGLTALLHRAFPIVKADIRLSQYGASAEAAIALPLPSFIRYLNVSAYVLSSKSGLNIESISFGGLNLSGEWFIAIVRWLTDTFVQEQLVDKALNMITNVDINEQRIITQLVFNEALFNFKKDKSLLVSLRDDLALFGDVDKISFYYQSLNEFALQQNHKSSLAVFMRYVFDLAKVRSTMSDKYQAIEENQAAVMALVIYFGADRFELMVGNITQPIHEELVVRNRMRRNVTLQGRVDLQKHFIYSMALQMFSTHGASDALGEFKEFLDTNSGGSGFSFADLQADRAGTRLAMILTKSQQHALQAQTLLATITDEQLLPSIEGLDEGLNEKKFENSYQNVDSEDYKQTLSEIDNRLKTLNVYQLGWE